MPPDLEQVELVAEDDGIKDMARFSAGGPAVETAEVVHRDVLGVVVGYVVEGRRWLVPERAEEVGDLLAVVENCNYRNGDNNEE